MAAGLYDITNKTLGRGHFGVVKLAKQCLTGESVAVKIVDKLKLQNDGLQQLGLEIKLLSRLSEKGHPNIIKLYQVIDTNSKLYLVMEYSGKNACDLYSYIRKNNFGHGLRESEVRHIFKQICSAIFYCHSMRIAHRDLKPENILIITESSDLTNPLINYPLVKLIDFGFSNQWDEGEKLRTSCGSLAYSPPEILLGDHYDADKVDIWSLGCILYMLLYGNNPFMQMNDSETLIRILDCRFKTPLRPFADNSSINLIQSMLKRDPKTRLTIQEVLDHPWFKTQEQKNEVSDCQETHEPENIKSLIDKESFKENESLFNISKQDTCSKLNNDDHIVDKIISKKINVDIENVLRQNANQASSCNLIEMKKKKEESQMIIDSIKNEKAIHYVNRFNDNFFTANCNLYKDEFSREIYDHVNSLNPSSFSHSKRLFLSRPKNSVFAQTSKIKTGHGLLLREIKEEKVNSLTKNVYLGTAHANENDGSFVLPLARKCSLVSEEGSCTGNDILANDLGGEKCNETTCHFEEPILSKSSVDIIVTDYSNQNLTKPNQNREEVYEKEECKFKSISPNFWTSTVTNGSSSRDSADFGKLHVVSSSPELRKESDEESLSNSRETSLSNSQVRPKMILNPQHDSRDYINEQIITHFSTKSNQPQSSTATSMRIIVHSKSYNNLLLPNENSEQGKKIKIGDSETKSNLRKRSKSTKPECCLLC